jgi:AraC-like DNA-binding protein
VHARKHVSGRPTHAARGEGTRASLEVARATGVTIRALHAAFRAHGGGSPLSFLRERRFELARARLLTSSAATVTDVALASGLEHLGRFSIEYKKRYGESPAQTLRRARDLQGPSANAQSSGLPSQSAD